MSRVLGVVVQTMSSAVVLDEVATTENMCANCGITGVDDIKLEDCTDCDLVKYCSDNCREEHREQHGEECKNHKAELHDRKLFTQPDELHLGECQICFLPLPIDLEKSLFYSCCSKHICRGCAYASHKSNGDRRCLFCRELSSSDDEENKKKTMERVKANDPVAMNQMGTERYHEGDYDGAFEYLTKAAELGDASAHHNLGYMYWKGEGVEKDEEKEVYHYEKAAICGNPDARHNLGCYEERNGNTERAVKHYIIAAKLGYELSMKALWVASSAGAITKKDLEATLRTHKAAIDATKSSQRDAAEAIYRRNKASR